MLGLYDWFARRAPNATVGYVDCKIRARLNKTLDFVVDKEDCHGLVKFSIKLAHEVRSQRRFLERMTQDRRVQRRIDRAQQRDKTNRNKIREGI